MFEGQIRGLKSAKMLKESGERATYTFSQPKLYQFFVNHGAKICLVLLLVLFLIAMIKNKGDGYLDRSIHIIIFISILIYLTGRLLRKFAYKIIVYLQSHNIRFFMNRTEDIIIVDFDAIRDIRVNGYIIFVLNERKIFYSGKPSKEILTCLNQIRKIHWGFLCVLLGPSKDVRDALGQT
jgi:uncharacterized membrane protein